MNLSNEQIHRLRLLSDNELYTEAIEFVAENPFFLYTSGRKKIKGLDAILLSAPDDINIIIRFFQNLVYNRAKQEAFRKDERDFYTNLLKVVSDNCFKKFFHLEAFSDCLYLETDSVKEKKLKHEKQEFYTYHFAKEFLYHIIAEVYRAN